MIQDEEITIVIPAYNEDYSIPILLDKIVTVCPGFDIVVVDNGSVENLCKKIESFSRVRCFRLDVNKGYGTALHKGFQNCSSAYVVFIDGDLEYSPEVIPAVVELLQTCDLVLGSRILVRTNWRRMGLMRLAGNAVVSVAFSILNGRKFTDLYTGLRGIRREAFQNFAWQQEGFLHVTELASYAVENRLRVGEVPVIYSVRGYGKSKMKHMRELYQFVRYTIMRKKKMDQ